MFDESLKALEGVVPAGAVSTHCQLAAFFFGYGTARGEHESGNIRIVQSEELIAPRSSASKAEFKD